MQDSNFSAVSIGTVDLLNVSYANGGSPFGAFARADGGVKRVTVKDGAGGKQTVWPLAPGVVFNRPDLTIQLL